MAKMGRPLEKYPKRNAIAFRVSDPDLAALQYLADQAKHPGETFNETLSRLIRELLIRAAEKSYFARRERLERDKIAVSLTKEQIEKRRKKYREDLMNGAKWAMKNGMTQTPPRSEYENEKSTSHEKSASHCEYCFPSK